MTYTPAPLPARRTESGNMLFIILIAIALIGLLTAAIQMTSRPEGANIDRETLAVRASEVQRYASELERGILFIMQNGASEMDVRFAHPNAPSDYGDITDTPQFQIFAREGGGASYSEPPEDINDLSPWEFSASTAVPGVGSDKADLVAVLPRVSQLLCDRLNELAGQSAPTDSGSGAASGANPGDCISTGVPGYFSDTRQFYDVPNTMDTASFTQDPQTSAPRTALQACVKCQRDDENYFYHVLMAR
jgi:hypothetical protein